MQTTSFYSTAPVASSRDAGDQLGAYLAFLHARNGSDFARRDQMMAQRFDHSSVRASILIDSERFNRNYAEFTERDVSPEELALLAFVKINAGEAYGVEVTRKARKREWDNDKVLDVLEQVVLHEEDYHTRLLVGAAQHFEGLEINDAWRPAWPLRLLIGALSYAPKAMFHPIVLGSEISGVHAFNWLLERIQTLFPDDPKVRESMEERLIEILIDEVGHVAYNRILVGKMGRSVAGVIARMVSKSARIMNKELLALGFDDKTLRGVEGFDYMQLPEEVRRRSFFV